MVGTLMFAAVLNVAPPHGDAPFDLAAVRDRGREMRRTLQSGETVEVVFLPGVYLIDRTIDLGPEDSRTVWRADKPGRVRFRGGRTVPVARFSAVRTNGVEALVADVSDLLPRNLPPWPREFRCPPSPWLYRNSSPMEIARWPNGGGWMTYTKAVASAEAEVAAGGEPAKADSVPCEDAAMRRWDFEKGIWFYGYWAVDWSESYVKGADFDPETGLLRFAGKHHYGFGGNAWGFKARRFFALNAMSELDAPGEWFLDRERKRLYVVPREGEKKAEYVLATLESPFVRAKGLSDFSVRGITFECSHAPVAVELNDSVRVRLDGCTLGNLGGMALKLTGRDSSVRNCRFGNIGKEAVSVSGGDRKTLTGANIEIARCKFRRWARFTRTYNPAVLLDGCGVVVRNCVFREAPHNAILYGGNNHLIEGNEFDRVLLETADAGAIYTGRNPTNMGTMIRDNWFHDLGGPDMPEHTVAVYFDDCDWGDNAVSNRFERCGRGILLGGGNLFRIEGNTFDGCKIGIHIDSRGKTWKRWTEDLEWFDKMFSGFKPFNAAWRKAFPELERTLADEPQAPWNNALIDNRFINCKENLHIDKVVEAVTNRFVTVPPVAF